VGPLGPSYWMNPCVIQSPQSIGVELEFQSTKSKDIRVSKYDPQRLGFILLNKNLIHFTRFIQNGYSSDGVTLPITAFRKYLIYTRIIPSTEKEIIRFILIWNTIAIREGIQYAFVGEVAAWIKGCRILPVYQLDILLSRNSLAKVNEVYKRKNGEFAVTCTNRHIILTRKNELVGMATQLHYTGEDGYCRGITTSTTEYVCPMSHPHNNRCLRVPLLRPALLANQGRSRTMQYECQLPSCHQTTLNIDWAKELTVTHQTRVDFWIEISSPLEPPRNGMVRTYQARKSGTPRRR
jgi:hypothetical protein